MPTSTLGGKNSIGTGDYLLPISFFRLLLRFSAEQGVKVETLLQQTELDVATVFQPALFIRNQSYKQAIDNLLVACQDPNLPIKYAVALSYDDLGPLGLAIRSSQSLLQAWDILPNYLGRASGFTQTARVVHQVDCIRIVLVSEGKVPRLARFNLLATLLSLTMLGRRLTGHTSIKVRERIEIEYPSEGLQVDHAALPPGLELTFDCSETALVIPKYYSLKTITSASPELRDALIHYYTGPSTQPLMPMMDKVLWVLRSHFPEMLTAQQTSTLLNISIATLKRQLSKEGTQYKALKDQVRFDQVQDMLLNTTASLEDIAVSVGFENASNLATSFKNRYHMTLGKFRQQQNRLNENTQKDEQ